MTDRPVLIADNVPWAGLGNRLRFTLSARAVADAEGREFAYSWPVGPTFGSAMTDLWQFDAERVEPGTADLTEQDDLTRLRDQSQWRIRSASVIKGDGTERSWEEDLANLPLLPEHAEQVAAFKAEHLPRPYVGVQIRCNDKTHVKTREASPPAWFRGRMARMRDADADVRFFVSCDVPEVQESILEEFPTAVALDGKAGYNSGEAIRASVMDLYLLAGSTHLLGPYWSSFVQAAWIIGGKAQALETSKATRPAVGASRGGS